MRAQSRKSTTIVLLRAATLGASVVLFLACEACEEKHSNLAPVASALASSAPPLAGSTVKRFLVDPSSRTSIEMEAPKEKIKASTSAAGGTIDVDPSNLVTARGEIRIDLSTLATSTFAEADKNQSQTTHARTWLEVGDGEGGKLDEKTKESNRFAVYAIRAIEKPSATDVTKLAPSKDGADDVRTVTLTTRGELLVHGHKVERTADVEIAFRYEGGAAPDKPKALTVRTKAPLRIVLAEHDIKPRDGLGKIAKSSFHLLGTKVADNADIGLDLRAKLAP